MPISVTVSEVMMNMMKGMITNVLIEGVEQCALKYGFSKEEALRELGVSITIGKKQMKKEKELRSFPLPFNGEHSDVLCQALRQNNGLYTQCQGEKKEGAYCKSCSIKMVDGVPEYGTISERLSRDILNYVDPKGRKPIAYTKVMKKYKLTKEQVLEEAGKHGITINECHFVAPEEPKRGRKVATIKEPKEAKGHKGRPKKIIKVVEIADDDDDLFASLVASAHEADNDEEKESEKAKKAEEKAKKEQEKSEKEAKIAAEKAEKEAKIAAEKEKKEQEKAEKEAKLAAEKAEKEAKKAAEKEKKEQEKAEKEAKIAAEKAEKEAKKEPNKKTSEPEEEVVETYKKCGEVNGVKYIRSQQTGIVYDFNKYTDTEELFPVGKWNEEKKEIIFDKAESDDDELSED